MTNQQEQRLQRARRSLDGLSVGDALGERFFGRPEDAIRRIETRVMPKAPWTYTDDTEMALSVYEILREFGEIDQSKLATAFASRMQRDRGYGRGAFEILWGIRCGQPWRELSYGAFGGTGSFGNGAAMRVAPLGAYFADDIKDCAHQARLQSEVTHAHNEGIAGGIAVAVATALCWQEDPKHRDPPAFIREVLQYVPSGYTHDAIREVLSLKSGATLAEAAALLGNGSAISAADTVPLCLWVVSRRRDDYEGAFWETVRALGDRDTTCAIVGGILSVRAEAPKAWVSQREPLPLDEA